MLKRTRDLIVACQMRRILRAPEATTEVCAPATPVVANENSRYWKRMRRSREIAVPRHRSGTVFLEASQGNGPIPPRVVCGNVRRRNLCATAPVHRRSARGLGRSMTLARCPFHAVTFILRSRSMKTDAFRSIVGRSPASLTPCLRSSLTSRHSGSSCHPTRREASVDR